MFSANLQGEKKLIHSIEGVGLGGTTPSPEWASERQGEQGGWVILLRTCRLCRGSTFIKITAHMGMLSLGQADNAHWGCDCCD